MKIKGADYVYYDVTDLKKASVFYTDVMGMKVSIQSDEFVEFDLGNITFSIGQYAGEKAVAKKEGPSIALAVDGVPEALTYLRSKKVAIIHDIVDTPVCQMAIIADPDGNQIILHTRKDGTVG